MDDTVTAADARPPPTAAADSAPNVARGIGGAATPSGGGEGAHGGDRGRTGGDADARRLLTTELEADVPAATAVTAAVREDAVRGTRDGGSSAANVAVGSAAVAVAGGPSERPEGGTTAAPGLDARGGGVGMRIGSTEVDDEGGGGEDAGWPTANGSPGGLKMASQRGPERGSCSMTSRLRREARRVEM